MEHHKITGECEESFSLDCWGTKFLGFASECKPGIEILKWGQNHDIFIFDMFELDVFIKKKINIMRKQ